MDVAVVSGSDRAEQARKIARERGKELRVVSTYAGETEKSLARLLAEADAADVVLLLDDADELLGRRADAEGAVAYLRRRLEEAPDRFVVGVAASGRFEDAGAYDRFMGRYSVRLSRPFLDFAGVSGGSALDVGCGPGALTGELVARLGAENVAAADPSEPFVAAARERHPGVDVRLAPAEELPFGDGEFDAALAQLVVHFMADPVAGLREMARVSRGVVAACVWDLAGERSPLAPFWRAARELDPSVVDESGLPGAREGHLGELLREAGVRDVEDGELRAAVEHATFEEWWEPFTLGVGPAGAFAASLDEEARTEVRERARALLPAAPFELEVVAWAARGRA